MSKQEKFVIIFLLAAAVIGLAVRSYKNIHRPAITIKPSCIQKEIPGKKGRININTADEKQLMSLEGIGPVLAKNIAAYRQTNSPFYLPEDILKVPGIGKSKFDKIKDFITTQNE
ncbi:MAG: helix-hairpin-helix domain-containing protein [Candidatus Omnitrophica bacterium]|nr:helix-hairpin-helix domain-containing protein [Candidatus Omnitrophota bacterium]